MEGIDDQIRMKRELREQEEARERAIGNNFFVIFIDISLNIINLIMCIVL